MTPPSLVGRVGVSSRLLRRSASIACLYRLNRHTESQLGLLSDSFYQLRHKLWPLIGLGCFLNHSHMDTFSSATPRDPVVARGHPKVFLGPPDYADLVRFLAIIDETRWDDMPLGQSERTGPDVIWTDRTLTERQTGGDSLYIDPVTGYMVDQWATSRRQYVRCRYSARTRPTSLRGWQWDSSHLRRRQHELRCYDS